MVIELKTVTEIKLPQLFDSNHWLCQSFCGPDLPGKKAALPATRRRLPSPVECNHAAAIGVAGSAFDDALALEAVEPDADCS